MSVGENCWRERTSRPFMARLSLCRLRGVRVPRRYLPIPTPGSGSRASQYRFVASGLQSCALRAGYPEALISLCIWGGCQSVPDQAVSRGCGGLQLHLGLQKDYHSGYQEDSTGSNRCEHMSRGNLLPRKRRTASSTFRWMGSWLGLSIRSHETACNQAHWRKR